MSILTAIRDRAAGLLDIPWMDEADRAVWACGARTLADLGELTAAWLEGEIAACPSYGGRPDPETGALVPVLARLNRAGFLTACSQPGVSAPGCDGAYWRQCAAVEGFAGEDVAARIINAANDTGLHVIAYDPASLPRWRFGFGREIPVTWRECEEYTWFGAQLPRRELRSRRVGYGVCHRAAVRALCSAWQVAVIDLEWGRTDLLWDVLDRALAGNEVAS